MITLGTITAAQMAAVYRNLNTLFMQGFNGPPVDWNKIATLSPSTTSEELYAWVGSFPQMVEWFGDRTIQNLAAHGYIIKNRDFEVTLALKRNDVLDNKLGMYNMPFVQLGESARTHPDSLVFALLAAGFDTICYDGQYFIDDDHPVGSTTASNDGGGSGTAWYLLDTRHYIKPIIFQQRQTPQFVAMDQVTDESVFMRKEFLYGVDDRKNVGYGFWQMIYGSKQTLDADSYEAGRAAMRGQVNDKGTPLNFMPNLLVVPPSLEGRGLEILRAASLAAGGTNIWQGTAELLVSSYLS